MNSFETTCRYLRQLLTFSLCAFFTTAVFAQHPVVKIDCDISGRQLAEVLEPGYTPWALEGASKDTARLSLPNGIQITLIRKGPYGTQLRTNWNKTIVQLPYLAKLIGDGFTVDGAA